MFTKSAAFYDAIYSWKNYETESQKIKQFIHQHQQSDGNALLDVACGTGGHIPFLRDEYLIEGLDLDEAMLKVASERFPDIRFYHADMVNFDLGKQYDVITCLFSSIGYVRTVNALNQTLATIARHLKPGGVLILEPWFFFGVLTEGRVSMNVVDQPELKIVRMSNLFVKGTISELHFHYMVGRPGQVDYFTEQHDMGLFTPDEYTHAFRSAGLTVTHDGEGLMDRGLFIGTI